YNLALRMTGNEQDAKDVVQESLLSAYLHLEQFERRADLRTWLNRILMNRALDHLRGLRRIINQALAFVSLSSYTMMRNIMRVASQQPASYTLIVGAVAIQVVTGAAMGMRNVRAGAFARNLQAVSGWYLAAFLLTHVFSGLLSSQPQAAATVAPSVNQFNLLAGPRSAAQLPYLLLGVSAFLFHVGIYARLAALAYLAEASVRRLSYAAMFVGTTVVVTVGLALCGIHVIR
ncbi:MAG: sigma factor, partial [Vicinamibacterales bacterium]